MPASSATTCASSSSGPESSTVPQIPITTSCSGLDSASSRARSEEGSGPSSTEKTIAIVPAKSSSLPRNIGARGSSAVLEPAECEGLVDVDDAAGP